ncbi:MAG: serine aminopeptidase domain-containing protein, partial [Acidobacteriota bacterium]
LEAPVLAPLNIEAATVTRDTLHVQGLSVVTTKIFPDNPQTDQWTIFGPGFFGTAERQRHFLSQLAQKGYPIVTFDNKLTGHIENEKNASDKPPSTTELVQAAIVLATLDTLPATETAKGVNAIFHSQAAIYGSLAATMDPDHRIGNIVYVNPKARQMTRPRLYMRGIHEALTSKITTGTENTTLENSSSSGLQRIREVVQNTWRTRDISLPQLSSIAHSATRELLMQVHDAGIGVGIVWGEQDKIFLPRESQRIFTRQPVDGFGYVQGHHEISTNPQGYAQKIHTVFERLHARQQERALPTAYIRSLQSVQPFPNVA